MTGRWRILTENSCYIVDMDEQWAQREPSSGRVWRELRRDTERVPLLAMYECVLDKPMVMLLQIRDDGVPTLRRTSHVVAKFPFPSEVEPADDLERELL